ncbi:MAG: hypothetical protein EXR07_06440 [Acetobacteraceae bacterium]|nr:hypothetical protein [Acetobacteraceae bacterium]
MTLTDDDGKIKPHDHPDILNDHHVIRWITPGNIHPDDRRLISGAFSESRDGGMSVEIEEWLQAAGFDRLKNLPDPSYGAVRLNVGALRKLGFQVGWDPDQGHPQHGAVWGIGNGSTRRRKILGIAERIRPAKGEKL